MKKYIHSILSKSGAMVAVALFMATAVFAQERTVSGTVTDETGSPMPGVSIAIKNTSTGTVTGSDGKYTISIPNSNSVLVFSFVGYSNSEILVGDQTAINVQMSLDVVALSEIV